MAGTRSADISNPLVLATPHIPQGSVPPSPPTHHVDVKQLGEMSHGRLGNEVLNDEHTFHQIV
jgi:hypothetical protein